jgi:hypothetical protein
MPYTEGELDDLLKPFVSELLEMPKEKIAGEINRIICRLYVLLNRDGVVKKYFDRSWFIGTVVNAILEIYRREIAVYENAAIERNGDIFEEIGGES